MLPIVDGLETRWSGQIEFVYLDIADSATAGAKARLGFRATPHFFLLRSDGSVMKQVRGIVERDSLDAFLAALAAAEPARTR